MVGFAVIEPAWKPTTAISDYKFYRAFGIMLMISRLTLLLQYGVTSFFVYTSGYRKTVIPLLMVMGSTMIAAILYGSITGLFPTFRTQTEEDGQKVAVKQTSNVYIFWYVIAVCETALTVGVSMVYRVISFKGTHMVQRMSLLTLIILGEGIIVICKSISKIVKNDADWTSGIVGQIVAATLIIYWLESFPLCFSILY